jgi:hypothetical protein
MRIPYWICTLAVLQLILGSAVHAQSSAGQDRYGLRCVSSKPFDVPPESSAVSAADCDFEQVKLPPGWGRARGEVITADDAPQGKAYFRMSAMKGADLRSPEFRVASGRGYFVSYWLKTPTQPWAYINFTSDEREASFNNIYPGITFEPCNQWTQVGFYFWMPAQCQTIQFLLAPHDDSPDAQFVSVDDLRIRTASESEITAAYKAERALLPAYDVSPRPGNGKNLALSVAKWEGRAGIPGKPFVIWALGSSYTAWQGDGFELIQAIRGRFPKAPPIVYRKHGGPGTPWEFVYTWIKQFVAAEQPDLIFCYTTGTLEGLDALLSETRRRTTAEIMVPSVHFKPPDKLTPEVIEKGAGVDWAKVREICAKHGAEFVENRRELAAYITRNHLHLDDLLFDHNHQNQHGRIRIWDNVSRHLNPSDRSTYTAESRERRIPPTPLTNTKTEQVSLSGDWLVTGEALRTSAAGARLKINFVGNRLDLIGRKGPGGGTIKVLVDGVAGGQASFVMNSIMPSRKHLWKAPHAVDLGSKPVPQKWLIMMTSDVGDYRLEGSVTGFDGQGNLAQPFLSRSGQVGIQPTYWRQGRVEKKGQGIEYGVAQGDSFTFDVQRAGLDELSFRADQPVPMAEPLVRDLPNGQHTVELITTGDGMVAIEGLYVFEPPEKD